MPFWPKANSSQLAAAFSAAVAWVSRHPGTVFLVLLALTMAAYQLGILHADWRDGPIDTRR